MKLQERSYVPVSILGYKITLGTNYKYLLPSHFLNDALTTL
ncbi:MAG TPA: hypothetical protein PLE33_03290 [Candidatus Cloacimonas sp.]|nr:hypothetical protein [Candidatus Cloacimonas sp.]